jgi:acetyl esterase
VVLATRLIESVELGAGLALAATPAPVIRAFGGKPDEIDGQTLDREIQVLVRAANRLGLGEEGLSPAQERARARRGARIARGRTVSVGDVRQLRIPGAAGELDARLYVPAGAPTHGPLLVYFHGGGYVVGDLDTHDQTCRFLCRHLPSRVFSVAYRLVPEHPFPAAIEDGVAAYRHSVTDAPALGADPGAISVGGDSAGGGLAAALAQVLRDEGGPAPASQLLIYPWSDLSRKRPSVALFGEGYFMTERELDRWSDHCTEPTQRTDPRISPLLADDLSGLPPAHVLIAGFDPLRDEGLEYAEALRRAGNEVTLSFFPGLVHAFINAVGTSAAARGAMGEFCATVASARPLVTTG